MGSNLMYDAMATVRQIWKMTSPRENLDSHQDLRAFCEKGHLVLPQNARTYPLLSKLTRVHHQTFQSYSNVYTQVTV